VLYFVENIFIVFNENVLWNQRKFNKYIKSLNENYLPREDPSEPVNLL